MLKKDCINYSADYLSLRGSFLFLWYCGFSRLGCGELVFTNPT
jgi:hypothetical protein